jgi:hypothetical protein
MLVEMSEQLVHLLIFFGLLSSILYNNLPTHGVCWQYYNIAEHTVAINMLALGDSIILVMLSTKLNMEIYLKKIFFTKYTLQ